jgi:YihY family inner membrane protein
MARQATNAKQALDRTCADLIHNRALHLLAARSSFYFFLTLLLALTVFLVAGEHRPDWVLFNKWQHLTGPLFPPGLFGLLRRVAGFPHQRRLLSLGVILTLWVASSGFCAAIEALNIAYDAGDDRGFWHTRFLAFVLTVTSGPFLLFGLGIVLAAPAVEAWLRARPLPELVVLAWPYVRWVAPAVLMFVAAITLYYLGPNVKQRLAATLPGVFVAAACCLGFSGLFEVCLRQFANFHVAYLTLGVSGALMLLWLNWTGLAMLVGAALNLELSILSARGRLQEKHAASTYTKLDLAS